MSDKQFSTLDLLSKAVMFIIAGIVAFLLPYHLVYFLFKIAPQENEVRVNYTVKSICDWSRSVQSRDAEKACGIAQDKSQTEYLCPSYNAPNNKCWIEDKR